MSSLAGLLLRVFLSLSLAILPGAQALAMVGAGGSQMPAASCHGMDHSGQVGSTTAEIPFTATASPSVPGGDGCDHQCSGHHCHCLSALALPSVPGLITARLPVAWEAWLPLAPRDPLLTPTPPPPRS